MKHLLQALATEAQQASGTFHRPDRPRALRGWKTVSEIARELKFTITAPADPEAAAREWLRRHHVPSIRRGRTILVDQFDLDRALTATPPRNGSV